MKTKHIIKRLKEDTAYQEFFQKAMKKFDISSPTDLKDPEKKKNFFNYVDKNYSAKSEGRLREVAADMDLGALRDYIAKKYYTDTKLHDLFNQTLKAIQMNSQVAKWKAVQPIGQGLNEAYFPAHGSDSQDLRLAKQGLANWFNNVKSGKVSPQSALQSQQLDILHDLIEDYALAYAEDELAAGEKIMSRKF
jgi:Asp-tRNA(Asn)/Glu-tRNA(Gln) amidotransferase B subunit